MKQFLIDFRVDNKVKEVILFNSFIPKGFVSELIKNGIGKSHFQILELTDGDYASAKVIYEKDITELYSYKKEDFDNIRKELNEIGENENYFI